MLGVNAIGARLFLWFEASIFTNVNQILGDADAACSPEEPMSKSIGKSIVVQKRDRERERERERERGR